jgi:hypothetical protein
MLKHGASASLSHALIPRFPSSTGGVCNADVEETALHIWLRVRPGHEAGFFIRDGLLIQEYRGHASTS